MPLTAEVVEEQVEAEDSNKQEDLQDSDSSLHDNATLFEPLLESEPLPSEHSETLLTEAQEDSEESDAKTCRYGRLL
ncbi:hypothetical protein ABG810_05930 [Streptococcus iniae]